MKIRNTLSEKEKELVSILIQDCQSTGDIQAKLKRQFAGTIEQMLEAEMEEHLGYKKHDNAGDHTGNSRNGYNTKTITNDYGKAEIHVPRDRNGEFEPKVLAKRQVRTDEIEQKILAINTIFPKTKQQLCIVHQVRNSVKFVRTKTEKPSVPT